MEDYRLDQSGQEVQDILNGAAMQVDLTAETERATEAEQTLQSNIDAEATRAQGAEGTLQDNIDAEEARAKAAEKQNADDIDAIEEKIPSGASSSNKLATEEYVADSVATATATFRGTYNLVSDLHLTVNATEQQIAAALAGAISTADNNDYCFILVPTSSETPTEIKEIDRYKFNGTAWGFEYKLNNSGFTAAQWAAINSGITSGDVAKLAALPTNAQLTTLLAGLQSDIDGEEARAKGAEGTLQDNIDAEETRAKAAEKQNADDIDAIEAVIPESASSENKVATESEINSLSAAIEAILLLIPSAATSLNKLADKAFVNSSIATATATFRGTYNLVNDLGLTTSATHAQIATALAGAILTADNNDYAFVQIPTSDAMPTEIAKTERYKFNGTAWEYEYDLNNSGFTADQWAAINSGITQALVTKLSALPTNAELTTELGTLTSGITTINQKIPNAASQANKLVDTAAMESYIVEVLNVLTISYNVTSTDGHVTLSIEQVDGKITSVTLTTSDIASAADLNLKASQADLTALASRVTTAEGNITTLGGRMTTAESNITSLGGRMTTAEGNITSLGGRMTTAEGNITTINGNITSLGGRVSTNETDIANLQELYNSLQQSKPVPVDALPETGQQQGVIYRLSGTTSYSDYMWNGSTWVLMATYNNAIDPRPKKASQNLVTSGGVFDNMGALDVSELNATENPHTLAQYTDLSAAIAAIPTDYQKGGMSIKFVQSSDNKYVQYKYMLPNVDIQFLIASNWQGVDEELVAGSDNLTESGVVYNSINLQSPLNITPEWGGRWNGSYVPATVDASGNSSIAIQSVESGSRIVLEISSFPVEKDVYVEFDFNKQGGSADYLSNGTYRNGHSGSTTYGNVDVVKNRPFRMILRVNRPSSSATCITFAANSMSSWMSAGDTVIISDVSVYEYRMLQTRLENLENTADDAVLYTDDNTRTPLEKNVSKANIGASGCLGNIIGVDSSLDYFDGMLSSADVDYDSKTVVSAGKNHKVYYKQVKKGEIFTIYALNNTGEGSLSYIVLYTSNQKPTIGTTGLSFQYSKLINEGIQEECAEWTAESDGYLIVRCVAFDTNIYTIFKKIDFAKDVLKYVEESVPITLTKNKYIDADKDSANYGEQIQTSGYSYGSTDDYIPIPGVKYVGIWLRYSTSELFLDNVVGSVFYDSNKTPISTATINVWNKVLTTKQRVIIPVPSGAQYVRFTGLVGTDNDILVYKTLISELVVGQNNYKSLIQQAKYVAQNPTTSSLGLLHFTDVHEDDFAASKINEWAVEYQNYINDVICTGDVVRTNLQTRNGTEWWRNTEIISKSLFVLGNHDQAYSSNTTRRYSYFFADAGQNGDGNIDLTIAKSEAIKPTHIFSYNKYIADTISSLGVVPPVGYDNSSSPYYQACYWHKDYSAQKIRIIGVDCIFRFDGILAKDGSGNFIIDSNTGMLSIAENGQGYAKLTTEQETWLYNKLNETLDSSNAAYGYSVVIVCHYPLDDCDGFNTLGENANRQNWSNVSENGGIVLNHRTGDTVNFHYGSDNIELTLTNTFDMRNRVQDSSTYGFSKGDVNNMGDILQNWQDNGGKFVAWICGHTHVDRFYYPKRYPNMLCVVLDQAGSLRDHNQEYRVQGDNNNSIANYYCIDTQNGLFKIVRFGLNNDKLLTEKSYLCYDYVNKFVVNER